MKIVINCPCCGSSPAFLPVKDSVFEVMAYDSCVEWSDEKDQLPLVEKGHIWPRSNSCPLVGEQRVIHVSHPFTYESGRPCYLVFMPALASINGLDEHPDEIPNISITSVNVNRIIEESEKGLWLQVELLTVKSIESFRDQTPVKTVSNIKERFAVEENEWHASFESWNYSSSSFQSNFGSWFLTSDHHGDSRLVAACNWFMHSEVVFVGCIKIDADNF